MATNTPVYREDHYIQRDVERSSSSVGWVIAAIVLLLAILLFGTNLFRNNGSNPGTTQNNTTITPPSTPEPAPTTPGPAPMTQ